MDPLLDGRTQLLLQREGAVGFSDPNAKLIEPIPRPIAAQERWLVHLPSGRIESAHPAMRALGDTFYVEYEPSREEAAQLKARKQVFVSRQMLARLRNPRDETPLAERMSLPAAVHEEIRRKRYEQLHGADPLTVTVPVAAPAPAPAPAATAAQAFSLPAEAMPPVPATGAFQLTPLTT